ncbi:hypothetical protein RHSIM_Rhsim03G0120000 [Rhododendron simsii]|uniref:Uncharacterized protein n=1 Tax=Rhododendron simsii TaxID=118357 RepID=A0A834LRX2_RHOSS|nr:hypothetical protein RHSIM_Rhsim03G0120000 [Rhododendron simsii]
MSQNKRVRIPYCQFSQEEKDRLNARRRALYAERRSRTENTLFPVEIQEEVSAEENIESSIGYSYMANSASNDQQILDEHNATSLHSLPSTSTSTNQDECMLYDVSIGILVSQIWMAPNIIPLRDIVLTSKNYTVQAMVIEKNIPRMSSTSTSFYQRIMLQDKEGNKIQASIFGQNIRILEQTLKLYHTYSITNAAVTETPQLFRFLENKNQLAINARTPVEEIHIDGLTQRTVKYSFTPTTALHQVKSRDAKLGLTLATRNSSSFIFDPPPLPEVTALRSWCAANAAKIRELPIAPVPQLPMPKPGEDSEDDITKIANLPISIEKIWKSRNLKAFENVITDAQANVTKTHSSTIQEAFRTSITSTHREPRLITWSPPPASKIKMNTNGRAKEDGRKSWLWRVIQEG